MIKNYLSILLLLIFTIGKSQFVGQYNMRDGGVDTPNSQLLILPENEFMLFYFAGIKKGIWKEMDKNTIALTETKLFPQPVMVYGKIGKSNAGSVVFDVRSLYRAHASIRFSKDQNFSDDLKPIFNNFPNCTESTYNIVKERDKYHFVNITVPANPKFGENGIRYPYKVLNYVFPLDKKFDHFTLLNGNEANGQPFNTQIIKNGNKYTMQDYGGNEELEREDFNKEILNQIKEAKNYLQNIENKEDWGEKIVGIEKEKIAIYKLNPNPYFKANCEEKENTNDDFDDFNQTRALYASDREDGVYTIANYKESNYDEVDFILAKKSSLNKKDILSAVKHVSDDDGYEIEITFTDEGAKKYSELQIKNQGKPLAFVIDHKIVDFYINMRNDPEGKVRIGYGISEKEMDELIKLINIK